MPYVFVVYPSMYSWNSFRRQGQWGDVRESTGAALPQRCDNIKSPYR